MKIKLGVTAFVATFALALSACASAESDPTPTPTPPPPLELSAGGGDAMAMCMAFDPAFLAEMTLAFEGTATAVEGERVTLEVDRWFKGGDAAEVALVAPAGLEALIGGINFEEGKQYLVSATDGTVNYCGFSGEATPELRAGFEAAFGS